jgi:hypothetical protein
MLGMDSADQWERHLQQCVLHRRIRDEHNTQLQYSRRLPR